MERLLISLQLQRHGMFLCPAPGPLSSTGLGWLDVEAIEATSNRITSEIYTKIYISIFYYFHATPLITI